MLVDHLVYYLIYQPGATWRDQDYRANKIVKSVKNETFKGTFSITVGGSPRTFSFATRGDFLNLLWPHMAKNILSKIEGNASLVPVPNSGATVDSEDEYKTLRYARAIATHSKGRLVAVDALRWQEAQEPQHKSSGRRTPESRFENMRVIAKPNRPILLFDDFLTSGSSLIAAYWRLKDAGDVPTRAFVIGRRTEEQHDKMTQWGSEDLEIPSRGFFF